MNAYLLQVPAEAEAVLLEDQQTVGRLFRESRGSSQRLELEETWAGLHFVLSGELPIPRHEALSRGVSWDDDSLENVVMGGEAVPGTEGWGPARYLEPTAVAKLAARLSAVSIGTFLDQYDPEALAEEGIPPGDWEENPEARDWLVEHFMRLADFYKRTAAQGQGLLICMA